MSTALIVGSAWTMADDLRAALALRPGAALFAVNRSGGVVGGDYLVFKDFPGLPDWHASRVRYGGSFTVCCPKVSNGHPLVDEWWPEANGGGTTSWCAVKIAKLKGFMDVILCGVPLSAGLYCDGDMGRTWVDDAPDIQAARKFVANDRTWHGGVSSMSGWTREFFGCPTA